MSKEKSEKLNLDSFFNYFGFSFSASLRAWIKFSISYTFVVVFFIVF